MKFYRGFCDNGPLGLLFATVDLKLTENRDARVFFEINPQGQFLYIEILTGLPISSAIAGFLRPLLRSAAVPPMTSLTAASCASLTTIRTPTRSRGPAHRSPR